MAALIVWTAFASVFSLLLGYSRVPYAAARDGNYFSFLAAVHPKHGIPHRSLVALGLVGSCLLLLLAGAGHHHAGRHAHPAAVLSAAGGRDAAPRAAAGVGAALQDAALPAAAAGRDWPASSSSWSTAATRSAGWLSPPHRRLRHADLSHPRPAAGAMAVCALAKEL
jgi:hypothetical protein